MGRFHLVLVLLVAVLVVAALAVPYFLWGSQLLDVKLMTANNVVGEKRYKGLHKAIAGEPRSEILSKAKGKTVLVTGGAGFIGSHVAEYCATSLQMNVVIVDNLSGGRLSNIPRHDSVSFVQGDIKDALFLEDLFRRFKFDYVYHLAAYAAIGLSPFVRSFNYRNNMVGTTELLNFAVKSKVDCFVFTSSSAVYGEGQVQLETTSPEPDDPYGISKYSSELDIKAAHKSFGLDSVILRLHNVYGPNQNFQDKYRNAIAIFMNQVMRGEPITIFGSGEQTRQFTYVSDIAPIIAEAPLVMAARNEIINLGGDKKYTLNQVANKIQHIMGNHSSTSTTIEHVEARQEVQHATVQSHSKLHSVFGKHDFIPLDDGLVLTAKSFSQQFISSLNDTLSDNNNGLGAVEILSGVPRIWATDDLEQHAKVDLEGPKEGEVSRAKDSKKCGPSNIAILIAGQFERFVFKDNTGPLVASPSSWWGCGKPVVDVYIALHRGKVTKPARGTVSPPPYITNDLTVDEIRQYFLQERNASSVHVKFFDDEQMEAMVAEIKGLVESRKLPGGKWAVKSTEERYRGFRNARMFYMWHLGYAMSLEQPKKYDVYVRHREDAFFYQPLNFADMGYNDHTESVIHGGAPVTSPQREVTPHIIVEKFTKFGGYSDKIHIGSDVGISMLFGKDWHEFKSLMVRFTDFAYYRSTVGKNGYSTEAFLRDILRNAIVHEIDLKRVDLRYVNGKRCVHHLYYIVQPPQTKSVLAKLEIHPCLK